MEFACKRPFSTVTVPMSDVKCWCRPPAQGNCHKNHWGGCHTALKILQWLILYQHSGLPLSLLMCSAAESVLPAWSFCVTAKNKSSYADQPSTCIAIIKMIHVRYRCSYRTSQFSNMRISTQPSIVVPCICQAKSAYCLIEPLNRPFRHGEILIFWRWLHITGFFLIVGWLKLEFNFSRSGQ